MYQNADIYLFNIPFIKTYSLIKIFHNAIFNFNSINDKKTQIIVNNCGEFLEKADLIVYMKSVYMKIFLIFKSLFFF